MSFRSPPASALQPASPLPRRSCGACASSIEFDLKMTLSPGLADSRISVSPSAMDVMDANADEATALLKALAHEGRLRILCHLVEGEKSVTELERLISARQSAVSQQRGGFVRVGV